MLSKITRVLSTVALLMAFSAGVSRPASNYSDGSFATHPTSNYSDGSVATHPLVGWNT